MKVPKSDIINSMTRTELWILEILRNLTNHPDDLKIMRTTDDLGVLLTITSNPLDAGLVIGRNGDVIHSIRVLARLMGKKDAERINIVYQDPQGAYQKAKQI